MVLTQIQVYVKTNLIFPCAYAILYIHLHTLHTKGIEMSDQDFRERGLESLSRIETQTRDNSTRLGVLESDVGR